MMKHEFAEFLKRLYGYFGAPAKMDDAAMLAQAEAWFGKVRELPAVCLDYMYERITDEHDRMPAANLPKVMKALWPDWRRDHPDRCAPSSREPGADCPDCVDGLLHLVQWVDWKGKAIPRTVCVGCARCRRAGTGGNYALLQDMLDQGWERQACMPSLPRAAARAQEAR